MFCGGGGEGGEKFKLAIDQSKISFIDNARNEDNHADEVGERALEMYFEVSESRFLQPVFELIFNNRTSRMSTNVQRNLFEKGPVRGKHGAASISHGGLKRKEKR